MGRLEHKMLAGDDGEADHKMLAGDDEEADHMMLAGGHHPKEQQSPQPFSSLCDCPYITTTTTLVMRKYIYKCKRAK